MNLYVCVQFAKSDRLAVSILRVANLSNLSKYITVWIDLEIIMFL